MPYLPVPTMLLIAGDPAPKRAPQIARSRRRSRIDHAVQTAIAQHGVAVVLIMVFAAELGLPTGVSPKVALLLAGSMAIGSLPGLWLGVALVTGAHLLGACVLHAAARGGGGWLAERVRRPRGLRPEAVMERWRARLGGHDAAAVFVGRLVPVVRIYVTLASGLLRLRWRDFLLGAAPAALVWSGGPLGLGYAFRGEVARLARSSWAIEAIVLVVPLAGVVGALGLWVCRAGSLATALRRGRLVAGAAGAVFVAAWVIKTARANEWAREHGRAALDVPVLVLWLALLVGLTAYAVAIAVAELRAAHGKPHGPARPRFVPGEVAGALAWSGALGMAGAIMVGIELLYPAL